MINWTRIIDDRATTKAERPDLSITIREAAKDLWEKANDVVNDIHLGVVGDDGSEDQPYQPDEVPTEIAAPAPTRDDRDEDQVQIFRNVDEVEFNDIAATQRFNIAPGMMVGKWFALTGPDAEEWGRRLNKGNGITVETRIPRSTFDTLLYHERWDGIGPAVWAEPPQLELINQTMDGIRVWP
ncbi:hypothetical protein [Haloechinothrix halophila]|uniref:hypothetical protein n=1 Tax=Haloechinothrix halophila TaxID=1069073 RepID=UPI0012F71DC8|nr:hypothetical protein [Haloechinothrix halophila]